jgi:hypothetical protein
VFEVIVERRPHVAPCRFAPAAGADPASACINCANRASDKGVQWKKARRPIRENREHKLFGFLTADAKTSYGGSRP